MLRVALGLLRKRPIAKDLYALIYGNPAVRAVFMRHHADLLDAAFWQGHKERILAGHVHDVFPYDESKRFAHGAA